MMKMWAIALLCFVTAFSDAEDSCPDVKIIGVGGSDNLAVLRGCPGTPGFPGQKGEKGEQGNVGVKGEVGISGAQGVKGEKGDASAPVYEGARNCKNLLDAGFTISDWYTISPDGEQPMKVLCDMHTDGGGWIVFQRRMDGSVSFYQDWKSYKMGFGSHLTEFWMGNDNIHHLTSSGQWELRVDLQDFDHVKYFAKYSSIKVLGESEKYKLELGTYTSGDLGDSLTYHNGMPFSTLDQDNELDTRHCSQTFKGGWWYNQCHYANLNGRYLPGKHDSYADGINWRDGKGYNYSYKQCEMKIRPVE